MEKGILQVLFLCTVAIIVTCFFVFDINTWLSIENIDRVKTYFLEFGYWAPVIMIGIYIILNLVAIPRVFLTIFSGYVFGVFYGFLFAWLATIIGLSVSFLVIRYLFRQSFEKRFGNKKLVEKVNLQIDKHGFWLVIFLRAIYIFPSSVLNYSFGFTKIKTSGYLLGSGIGFIPVVLVNVFAGNALAGQLKTGIDVHLLIIVVALLSLFVLLGNWIKKRVLLA